MNVNNLCYVSALAEKTSSVQMFDSKSLANLVKYVSQLGVHFFSRMGAPVNEIRNCSRDFIYCMLIIIIGIVVVMVML